VPVRTFPALDVSWPEPPSEDVLELLLAVVDDHEPTAAEEHPFGMRMYFTDNAQRDAALSAARNHFPAASVAPLLVPDENWAERSQAALRPVRIDTIIVAPPWTLDEVRAHAAARGEAPHVIAIQPSMGFGTGHHPSTRLCLRLLQRHLPADATVLDIGTGSGVLAIAAATLGAKHAIGIDFDRDALTSAAENIELNRAGAAVSLEVVDITRGADVLADRFSLVFANITGAMLQRHAAAVASTLAPGGVLIASGFQTHELDDVLAAFAAEGLERIDDVEEETWVAAAIRRR
jgi:ribosomal protein L11 methyltransferase